MISAIPTKYAGTQFRSRLEARWACFFDLVGWRWEYEPFDLNGWIPDFILLGKNVDTLVEIRPITKMSDVSAMEALSRTQASGDQRETLFLGCQGPNDVALNLDDHSWGSLIYIGLWVANSSEYDSDSVNRWNPYPFRDDPDAMNTCPVLTQCKGQWGFAAGCTGFDRIHESYDENESQGLMGSDHIREAKAHWARAGNTVQWRKKSAA